MARPQPRPYLPAARARVALSLAARDASDCARGLVPSDADGYAQPGSFVEDALRLRARADAVLALAVVLERERSTTWEEIGAALGGDGEPRTRQNAEARFGDRVRRWREALVNPWRPHSDGSPVYSALPDGAEDPGYWAGVLDDWVVRHAEPTDPVAHRGAERPVSAELNADPLLLLLTEERFIREQALALQARRIAGEPLLPAEVGEFHCRRQAFIDWIDEVLPRTAEASLRASLEGARKALAKLTELVPLLPEPAP